MGFGDAYYLQNGWCYVGRALVVEHSSELSQGCSGALGKNRHIYLQRGQPDRTIGLQPN